jgi:hypothetical protein
MSDSVCQHELIASNLLTKATPSRAQELYCYALQRTKAEGIKVMVHDEKEVCLARNSTLPIQ